MAVVKRRGVKLMNGKREWKGGSVYEGEMGM
jgi:hypothetical protein